MHHSKGFAFVEMAIALAVATAVAVWGANVWVNEARESAAHASSAWLWGVKLAMDDAVNEARNSIHLENGKIDVSQVKLPLSLVALKQAGHLAKNYPDSPPLAYKFSTRVIKESPSCTVEQCPLNVIMVLEPTAELDANYPIWSQASVMLMALKGQGLAVRAHLSDRLAGAQRHWPNPPDSGLALKVGSVATFSRVMLRAPPFVRLVESRPVTIAGDLNIKNGLVMEAVQSTDASCQVHGQVVRRAKGGLLVCEKGKWKAVGDDLSHKLKPLAYHACGSPVPLDSYLEFLMTQFAFDFRSNVPAPPGDCHCNAGYRPVLAHSARIDRHGVAIKNGFVCASP